MRFSPTVVTAIILEPLKYFFANYMKEAGLIWNHDEKIATMEIGSVNDFNLKKLDKLPRVLVNRGPFFIEKTSLSDNMSESKSIVELKGESDRSNKIFVRGNASIIIEARNEGTCELITDAVSHFIVWSRPFLMNSMNFKDFGLPMQVSEPIVGVEDTEKFTVTIQLPYTVEEDWRVNSESLKLKGFFKELSSLM